MTLNTAVKPEIVKHVLLVDDEAMLTDSIEFMLSVHIPNMTFEKASNGEEALKCALRHPPDIIISDINMPRMDGLILLQELRKNNIMTPVILVTAFSDVDKMRKAWSLGAFDYVEKPFEETRLVSTAKIALAIGEKFNQTRAKDQPAVAATLNVQISSDIMDKVKEHCKEKKINVEDFVTEALKKAA